MRSVWIGVELNVKKNIANTTLLVVQILKNPHYDLMKFVNFFGNVLF